MIQVWHYGTGVVLDGNSLKWKNFVQALKMMKIRGSQVHRSKGADPQVPRTRSADIPAGAPFRRCGPQFTHSNAEKHVHVGIPMFGPWYLARRS